MCIVRARILGYMFTQLLQFPLTHTTLALDSMARDTHSIRHSSKAEKYRKPDGHKRFGTDLQLHFLSISYGLQIYKWLTSPVVYCLGHPLRRSLQSTASSAGISTSESCLPL